MEEFNAHVYMEGCAATPDTDRCATAADSIGLVSDMILPGQSGRARLSGYERLWLGVLCEAILDYRATFLENPDPVRRLFSAGSRNARRVEILRWMMGGGDAPIGFKDICEHFDIPEERIWKKIRSYACVEAV